MTTTHDSSWLDGGETDGDTELAAQFGSLADRVSAALPAYRNLVFALVLVWGVGDLLSTYAATWATGSAAMETNPLVRVLLTTDPLLVLALKAAVVLVVGTVLLAGREIVEQVPGHRAWFLGCVGVGLFVTANNLAVGLVAVA